MYIPPRHERSECKRDSAQRVRSGMRVAIIHDWLNGMRGGERVLEELLGIFPGATIYTLLHEPGKVSPFIESHRIETSWLNRIPGIYRHYRNFLPMFPAAIESFDLSAYDLVISSSHSVAKGIHPGGALHICYCHTPMRYIWDAEDDYRFDPLRRLAMQYVRTPLQQWDCEAANRVHHFAATTAARRLLSIRRSIRVSSGRLLPPGAEISTWLRAPSFLTSVSI